MRMVVRALLLALVATLACQRAEPARAAVTPPGVSHQAADGSACAPNAKPANLDFTLKDMRGKKRSLESYKGKVLLVDFWATWCGPCKMEIPGFVELYDKYKSQGFEIIGLLTLDQVSNVPAFAAQFKMAYPILDATDRDDVQDAFGPLIGLPTSFLISRDGRICRTHIGYAPKERFDREIQALLAH
jgi:thiol-disulfide isomerase/thioredoxin